MNLLVMTVLHLVPQHDYQQVHGVRSLISSIDEDKRWYLSEVISDLYIHAFDSTMGQMALTYGGADLKLNENYAHQSSQKPLGHNTNFVRCHLKLESGSSTRLPVHPSTIHSCNVATVQMS